MVNEYFPDRIAPPFDTVLEMMCERLGLDVELIFALYEREELTEEMADAIQKQLGGSKSFWLTRDKRYRKHRELYINQWVTPGEEWE